MQSHTCKILDGEGFFIDENHDLTQHGLGYNYRRMTEIRFCPYCGEELK